jgi:hypothetical protein
VKKADLVANLGLVANVSIIVTATLLSVVLVKQFLLPKSIAVPAAAAVNSAPQKPPQVERIQPGAKFSLSGIDWAKNGKTLVLAVSKTCHFCTESAPFYQRLTKEHGKTALVALLPQPVSDGKTYLDQLNVQVDGIHQASLNTMGVRGTPTLLLIDQDGVVANTWVGKLAADQEAEVIASVK